VEPREPRHPFFSCRHMINADGRPSAVESRMNTSEMNPNDVRERLTQHFLFIFGAFAFLERTRKRPETVYHYTTAEGLLGILSTRTIWASNVQFLNDYLEVEFARIVTEAALRQLAAEVPSFVCDAFGYSQPSAVDEDLRPLFKLVRETPSGASYVACFCNDGDILSQWRGYANRGGGYAIGISTKPFLDEAYDRSKATGTPAIPLPVLYTRAEQAESVWNLVKIVPTIIANPPALALDERELWKFTLLTLAFNMLRLKDPVFSEEKEWRLLVTGRTVRFRVSGGRFVPFVEYQFKPEDVIVIVQGPTANATSAEASLRFFLDKTGFGHVRIERSAIPLV
jgi:Protein of unknown function (DUF2971)